MKKKSIIILAIISIFWLIMMIPYFLYGDVIIRWKTIIPLLSGLSLIVIITGIVIGYLNSQTYNKLIIENKYDKLLEKAQKIKRNEWISNQNIFINVAIVCLLNNDIENFYKYINQVNHKKLIAVRYYWETIKCLMEKDIETAKNKYILFQESPETLFGITRTYQYYETFLSGYFSFIEGNKQIAREKLYSIHDQIRNPIAKQICDEILVK